MRAWTAVLLALAVAALLAAQTYTIQTIAGGGLPENVSGLAASLGPISGVAVDGAGNVYMSLPRTFTVVKLDTSGFLTRAAGSGTQSGLWSSSGTPATSTPINPQGLATDQSGALYVAGGISGVFRISGGIATIIVTPAPTPLPQNSSTPVAGGSATVTPTPQPGPQPSQTAVAGPTTTPLPGPQPSQTAVAGPTPTPGGGSGSGSSPLINTTGVAVDSSGAIYVTDINNHQVDKYTNGVSTIVAGTGTGGYSGDGGPATSAQLNFPNSLAIDANGNLYIADTMNNRVRKVSNGIITTVAGTGAAGYGGDNGPATSAQLNAPWGVAVDAAGNLYIVDTLNNRIRKVSNGTITTVTGTGAPGFGGDGGPAINAQLNYPSSIALDAAGNLYIADTWNFRLRKVSQSTITTIAGNGTELGDNGPATSATVNSPSGLAVGEEANLYIADGNGLIRQVSGGVITTFAASEYPVSRGGISIDLGGFGFFGSVPAPIIKAPLGSPDFLAMDSTGALYVATEAINGCVEKLANGASTTVDGACGTTAQPWRPSGSAFDASGNLYIADSLNHRVVEVSNGVMTTIAGNGTAGYSGDGGPAMSAELSYPMAVVVDAQGDVYIADAGNGDNGGIIRKVSGGIITTIAGGGTSLGDGGPATGAMLNYPTGLALDNAGNLYIADSSNYRIRKISNGIITTIAGNGLFGFSGDGGPAVNAALFRPNNVAVDAQGNVYVADTGNGRVRLLTPVSGSGSGGSGSAPACTYTLDASGQFVPASGGGIAVSITTNGACPWRTSNAPAWVSVNIGIDDICNGSPCGITFAPGSIITSGAGEVALQVAANTGPARTATMNVAGQTFTVYQESAASITALPFIGSMPHIASGDGWDTAITLVNTGATAANANLSFFDDNGNPLPLPVTVDPVPPTASQQQNEIFCSSSPCSPVFFSILPDTLNPHAMTELDISDPSVSGLGSAQLASDGSVTGFGVFTYIPTGQAAVVPLETRNASSYLLAFDNTGDISTGLAIANLATSPANAGVIIRDSTGAQIGTGSISLAAKGHNSFMLTDATDGFPITAGKLGTIEFDTPQGGQISVLGLRANGNALTSLPVLANVGTGGGTFPHIAVGGDWQTVFTFVNTGTSSASFQLNFYDDNGNPLAVNQFIVLPDGETMVSIATGGLDLELDPGASMIVQASGASVTTGSAQFSTTGHIGGFVIFQEGTVQDIIGISQGVQEAVVPLQTGSASSYTLAFDNTNGLATGVALASETMAIPAAVPATLRDETGTTLATATVNLPANGHVSEMLTDLFPAAANIRGTVEFDTPLWVQIGVVGIRATPSGAFTTIPVIAK